MDLFEDNNQEIFNLFDDEVPNKKKQKDNAKSKKKASKIDYSTTMEQAVKSPFICKNHQNVHMRIRDYAKSNIVCGSCGSKLQGRSGFISCPKQSVCFSLCSSCKVCPKNHFLINCASLKHYEQKNALYAQNKFKCSGCEIEQIVGHDGVYHCPPCNFSICKGCIKRLDQIWVERSEAQDQKSTK